MNQNHPRISVDPQVMCGKPVIRGTRIPVEMILRHLGAGLSSSDIIDEFPHLTEDDVRAAQTFAADYLADEIAVYG